jgi:hypothetical protein
MALQAFDFVFNAYSAIHDVYHCEVMGECGVFELAHFFSPLSIWY